MPHCVRLWGSLPNCARPRGYPGNRRLAASLPTGKGPVRPWFCVACQRRRRKTIVCATCLPLGCHLAGLTPPIVAGILRLVTRGGFGRIGVVRAGRLNAPKMGNGERGGLLLSVAEGAAARAPHWNPTSRLIPATTDLGIDERTPAREPRGSRGESGSLREDGNGKTKHTA